MNEADERFAARLGEEVRKVLGPVLTLDGVQVDGAGPVTLTAVCVAAGTRHTVGGEGETLLEASRALVQSAAELRLADAWTRREASH